MKSFIDQVYLRTYTLLFSRLDSTKFKFLWHYSYWDGPRNGICEYDGKKCWFECVEEWHDNHSYPPDDDDFEQPWWRRFLLVHLTDEQYFLTFSRHQRFQILVGNHSTYDSAGRRSSYGSDVWSTKKSMDEFYAVRRKEQEFVPADEHRVLGWIER